MPFSYTVQKPLNLLPHFVTNYLKKYKFGKPFSVTQRHKVRLNFTDDLNITRYILDSQSANQQGGTGKTFNWSLIPEKLKHKIILAGGISPDNIEQAIKQGCLGVDLNSGVETAAGVKDSEKSAVSF